jgi:two-component system, NarL family, captular synthesis response regulator RcsB
MMDSDYIRVAVADDHPVIRMGIEAELEEIPTVRWIGSARDSSELVALLDAQPCDVLVTDYAMPGGAYGDGLELLSFIAGRYDELGIVVITAIDKPVLIRTLLSRGINSIVSKADAIAHVGPAVQAAHVGRRYHSPTIGNIVKAFADPKAMSRLSQREIEVITLFVSGASINEIAARLQRSKQTISTQKVNAMLKLGIEKEADLFKYAIETGMLSGPETD